MVEACGRRGEGHRSQDGHAFRRRRHRIAYQMHGLVLVDKAQKPLRPSIIWCDGRAVEIGERPFGKSEPAPVSPHAQFSG